MFPWIYEFRWTAGHVIFLGVFFTVVTVIITSVLLAIWRAYKTFREKRQEHVQWVAEFEDLPPRARACRHELNGEVAHRTCHNEFDCRACVTHTTFLAKYTPAPEPAGSDNGMLGFSMPLDRYYHRGHAWAKEEGMGVYTIGLDDFGSRLMGDPDAVLLPPVGAHITANGTGWQMTKQDARLRVLAPIDGTVIAHGQEGSGWYLKVRADQHVDATRHLLRGDEVRPWITREMERLQYALAPNGVGLSLADGGEMVPEMWKDAPAIDWDGVWGEMFLQA